MKNYGHDAAEWWCQKIEEQHPNVDIDKLEAFKKDLTSKINNEVKKYAHIELSTFKKSILVKGYANIFETANSTGVSALLPEGYEMSITYDIGIMVYDSYGMLVPLTNNVSLRCVC